MIHRLRLAVHIVAGLILPMHGVALGQTCFVARTVTSSLDAPLGLAVGDIDGDGNVDVVTASFDDDTIAWHENDGALSPSFSLHVISNDVIGASTVRVGDLDDDGDIDIAATGFLDGRIMWFENDGNEPPGFVEHIVTDFAFAAIGLSIADIDGDARLDLVAVSEDDDGVAWYRNDGGEPPAFDVQTLQFATAFQPTAFAVADANDDGHSDLVIASGLLDEMVPFGELTILFNDGADPPSFTPTTPLFVAGATSITFLDLDDDGDSDFVVSEPGFGTMTWYRSDPVEGSTFPRFSPVQIDQGLPRIADLLATDLDGDGDPDLISSVVGLGSLVLHENVGDEIPAFTRRVLTADVDGVFELEIANLEGDARGEIIAAMPSRDTVRWLSRELLRDQFGSTYDGFASAIATVSSGETLFASSAAFGACECDIDLQGKALEIRSDGPVERAPGTRTKLADGATLRSASGQPVRLRGQLEIPDLAYVELQGDPIKLTGPLLPGLSATLVCNEELHVIGVAEISDEPREVVTFLGEEFADFDFGDIDGDGDPDIASAGLLQMAWHESDGLLPPTFTEHVLGPGYGFVLRLADIDSDGDLDICALVFDLIAEQELVWYENDGQAPPTFQKRVVDSMQLVFDVDFSVADIDLDGDVDFILPDRWYENDGAPDPTFTEHPFASSCVESVVIDLDSDGDPDVVSACGMATGDTLIWYESDGGAPPTFTPHILSDSDPGIFQIEAVDIDDDGDVDLLLGKEAGVESVWYENNGATPPSFTRRVFSERVFLSTTAADLDQDGDIDIAVVDGDYIGWFEQTQDPEIQFQQRDVAIRLGVSFHIRAVDIDADGDVDLAVDGWDQILWFENRLRSTSLDSGFVLAAVDDVRIQNRSVDLGSSGTLAAGARVTFDSTSSLSGVGVLSAPIVESSGAITLTPEADLVVEGAYAQQFGDARGRAKGQLHITLTSPRGTSRLIITQSATLAGTLTTIASDDFDPPVGQTFEILTAGDGVTGRFDVAFLPALPDRFLSVIYPEPGVRNASVLLQVNELSGDVEFDPAPSTGAPAGTPTDAALADINLDGFVDLVMTVPDDVSPNQAPGSVLIFYNDGNAGDGSWNGFANVSVVQQIFTDIGIQPDGIAIGDLNDDDIPDLVIANRGIPGNIAPDSITVLINEPGASGTVAGVVDPFGVDQSYVLEVGDEPRDVALVDLDGDALLDIIVANAGSDTVTVLWNAGSSARARLWNGVDEEDTDELDLPPDACPFTIRPGEFDADLFHFAVGNTGDDSVTVVRNIGARDFEVMPPIAVDGEPVELTVTDIDLDGFPEIITVNRTGNSVSIIVNTAEQPGGGIAFAPAVDLAVAASPSFPRSIAAGDFDADLDPDIAIVAKGSEDQPRRVVKILRNDTTDGQIIFAPASDQLAGDDPLLVRSDDINNDGRDDLVTVNESLPTSRGVRTGTGQVAVLLATRVPEACTGDIDGDGSVSLSDFATLSRNFGATELPHGSGESRTLGDLDDDGDVDMDDFKTLSAGFGCRAGQE